MSYCVNCGVELEAAAKKCPLCETPVINPNIHKEDAVSSYSDKTVEIPESMKKRFSAFIITMVMLIPNIVCFLVNILFHHDYTWVWLLNATSVLIWTFIVLPLMWRKKAGIYYVLTDTVVSIGYVYIIYYLKGNGKGWFAWCALPMIIIFALLIGFITEWHRLKKPQWVYSCIAVFAEIMIASVLFDMILSHYLSGSYTPTVSLVISACCVAVIGFFIAVACNKKLKAWLARKFFVN